MPTIAPPHSHETIETSDYHWAGTRMHGSDDHGVTSPHDQRPYAVRAQEGTVTTLHRRTTQPSPEFVGTDLERPTHDPSEQEGTVATLQSRITPPLPESVEAELRRLGALPAGWNGAGIAAVTEFTIERTRFVLELAFFCGKGQLPEPFFSPAHDGRMILEWQAENDKELIVDVPQSNKASVRFLLVEPTPSGGESAIESEMSDEWSMQAIVNRLLDNRPTASS
jgi:hypothetical protein